LNTNKPRLKARLVSFSALALRAKPEELELVRNPAKTVPPADKRLQIVHPAFLNLNDPAATGANQVVVMTVIAFAKQLKTGHPIPEFVPFNHTHAFHEFHRTVNRCEVAIAFGELLKNGSNRDGMRLRAQQIKDGLPRAGNSSRSPTQSGR
jgi:hypothetical protein